MAVVSRALRLVGRLLCDAEAAGAVRAPFGRTLWVPGVPGVADPGLARSSAVLISRARQPWPRWGLMCGHQRVKTGLVAQTGQLGTSMA